MDWKTPQELNTVLVGFFDELLFKGHQTLRPLGEPVGREPPPACITCREELGAHCPWGWQRLPLPFLVLAAIFAAILGLILARGLLGVAVKLTCSSRPICGRACATPSWRARWCPRARRPASTRHSGDSC